MARSRIQNGLGMVAGWFRGGPSDSGPKTLEMLEAPEQSIVVEAAQYSMTGFDRLVATMDATSYVVANDIPGALVECGVWRGGSVLAMIRVLQLKGVDDRPIYLYDTFEGMTEPTEKDTSKFDGPALSAWRREGGTSRAAWSWAFSEEVFTLEAVRDVINRSGYPTDLVHFVVGPVEQTLPMHAPEQIALLRLDTDWYESTRHEMEHLYPRLSPAAVLIVDDYGHWDGARQAVEEYLDTQNRKPLLTRIDYTARMGVKPG